MVNPDAIKRALESKDETRLRIALNAEADNRDVWEILRIHNENFRARGERIWYFLGRAHQAENEVERLTDLLAIAKAENVALSERESRLRQQVEELRAYIADLGK